MNDDVSWLRLIAEWPLISGKKSIKLHVSGPGAARDFHAVSAFTYRGHSIGLLPSTHL
jgi:hypothetical protein